MDFAAMAELCAPGVAVETMQSIASVESSFNPFAIGVVGGRLQRQPQTLAEALATTDMLAAQGYDYSLGIVQINQRNFARFGFTPEKAFDPCANLRVGSFIFSDCYKRAGDMLDPFGAALSCYYSGNFTTGYQAGYVAKVKAVGGGRPTNPFVQAIPLVATKTPASRQRRSADAPREEAAVFVTIASTPVTSKTAGDQTLSSPSSKDTALLF